RLKAAVLKTARVESPREFESPPLRSRVANLSRYLRGVTVRIAPSVHEVCTSGRKMGAVPVRASGDTDDSDRCRGGAAERGQFCGPGRWHPAGVVAFDHLHGRAAVERSCSRLS